MSGEIPTPPANDPNDQAVNQNYELTPEAAQCLRVIQELVMKKGVDITHDDEGLDGLQEGGYIRDVLSDYKPTGLAPSDIEAKGIAAKNKKEVGSDGSVVSTEVYIGMPVGSAEHNGERLLVRCWLSVEDDAANYTGVELIFFTKKAALRQVPMVRISPELMYSAGYKNDVKEALSVYAEFRAKTSNVLEKFGILGVFDRQLAIFDAVDKKLDQLPGSSGVNQNEVDFEKFDQALVELVNHND